MKDKICKNCFHYTAYYRKLAGRFDNLKHGHCSIHEMPKTQQETCEKFSDNESLENRREKRMFQLLGQALTSINNISMILAAKEDKRK